MRFVRIHHLIILFSLFLQEHLNFLATDEKLGPILLSVKSETVAGHDHWRLILRLRTGTSHELVPVSCLNITSAGVSSSGPQSNGGRDSSVPCPARMAKVKLTFQLPRSVLFVLDKMFCH